MKESTFITRVVLKNYKSIAACEATLRPLTFLVGPNGAGKSNFLDALRFVADALKSTPYGALHDRGGIDPVLHHSKPPATHFEIRLDFALEEGGVGHYAIRIGRGEPEGYEVEEEECVVPDLDNSSEKAYFHVKNGRVTANIKDIKTPSAVATDQLYLLNASGLGEFHTVYTALSRMGFYNLNLYKIRGPQPPDMGTLLARDGGNLTSVFAKIKPPVQQRIKEYLMNIIPGLNDVEVVRGPASWEFLKFSQQISASKPSEFSAINMSDGTLRAFGILVALFQSSYELPFMPRVRLVGIEEPEIGLHPTAAGVLLDALIDASQRTQVLVTSHSPDLLDNKDLQAESILAVIAEAGTTRIGSLDDVGRSVIDDRLYTAGELLRLNQLEPDPEVISETTLQQPPLFEVDP